MANKGDKFIIEIDDVFQNSSGDTLYRIKGFNSLVFDDVGIGKLRPLNMNIALTSAREAGMREVWELCRKIECEIPIKDIDSIFHTDMPGEIYGNYTPNEAVAKIAEYEETHKNMVSVGDVVRNKKTGEKGIVVLVKNEHDLTGERFATYIMTADNVYIISSPDESLDGDFEKTGDRRSDFITLKASIDGFPFEF